MCEKGTLLEVAIKFLSFQNLSNLPEIVQLFFFDLAIDEDVIKVNNHKSINKGLNTQFVSPMKVLGAFERPKGITNYSYNPPLALNIVLHASLFLIMAISTSQVYLREHR